MKPFRALPLLASCALVLASCSSGQSAEDQPEATPVPAEAAAEVTTEPEATPSPEPTTDQPTAESKFGASERNERGNLVKTLGQLAGTGSASTPDVTTSEFTITAIEPNYQCTGEYAEPSKYGQYIAITMDIQTTPALADESWPMFNVSEYDFKVISPEGTTENDSVGNGYMCLDDSERLPGEIGPAEHVVGKVVLDSAHTTGSIVFTQPTVDGGWEWGY